MNQDEIIATLAQEIDEIAERLWPRILESLQPAHIAKELLDQLSGVPHSTGALFDELRNKSMPKIQDKGA